MDVTDISKSEVFADRLKKELDAAKVVLVVIGRTWLSVTGANGGRRIDDPDDFVRQEVATAIGRGVPVIPVLVDEARIPTTAELPEPLRGLAARNAQFLVAERFEQDADALAREVKRLIGRPEDAELDILKLLFSFKGTTSRKQFWLGLGLMLVLQLVVLCGVLWSRGYPVLETLPKIDVLPAREQTNIQLALLGFVWPTLALGWKRVRDLGHGLGMFLPILGLNIAQTAFSIAGLQVQSQTTSLIVLVALAFLGGIQGTRFVTDGARD